MVDELENMAMEDTCLENDWQSPMRFSTDSVGARVLRHGVSEPHVSCLYAQLNSTCCSQAKSTGSAFVTHELYSLGPKFACEVDGADLQAQRARALQHL